MAIDWRWVHWRSLPTRRGSRLGAAALAISLSASPASAKDAGAKARSDAPSEAPRPRAPVTLAEATSRVDPAETRLGDVTRLLREDVQTAILAVDWGALRLARRYAISAAVERLATTRTGDRQLASVCTVSIAVREVEGGTLLFVVQGRARAEDGASAAERAERDALRAAVSGAMTAVPDGLRRSR